MRRASSCAQAIVVVLVCVGALAASGEAVGQSCPAGDALEALRQDAGTAYVTRDFETVIELLQPVADNDCVSDLDARIELRLMLGTANFQLGELGIAELEYLQMLRLDPEFDPARVELPSRATAAFIERVREDNREELDELRADMGSGRVETFYVVVEKQRNQYWLNFLPFGAGQFQNGDTEAGVAFASVQGAALLASVAGAVAVEVIRGSEFTFSAEEAAAARAWQGVQLASAGVFLAVYAIGVGHALWFYEELPVSFVNPPTRERPDGLSDATPVEWHLAPIVDEERAGIGVRVTF